MCGLAKVAEEVDDDDDEDNSPPNEDKQNELTLDDINKIATSLKALSVSIDDLPLPSKYSSLGRDVRRKTRQGSALPFFTKQKKD